MREKTTEVMTQVKALTLGGQAISHLLTGQPGLETFDFSEVSAAFDLLWEQHRARKRARLGKLADEATFQTVCTALRKIYWPLHPTLPCRVGRVGRRRPGLEAAATALPEIIARIERVYSDYWVAFAESALAEAEAILEEAQA